jgi:hypothetical protein
VGCFEDSEAAQERKERFNGKRKSGHEGCDLKAETSFVEFAMDGPQLL